MNFKSDNTAGVCPEIMQALAQANSGYQNSYSNDQYTEQLQQVVSKIFQRDVAIYFTSTGTVANALALSALVPPYGAIFCHEQAHVNTDECGAVEFFSGGVKLLPAIGQQGKIALEPIANYITWSAGLRPHAAPPATISITQVTEAGTVYSLQELAAIGAFAKQHGLGLHMDGARFTNALVSLGCTPAQMTWQAGVDVLSFGATKNGAMMAEMVVFFDKNSERAKEFAFRHQRAGQNCSKARFMAAQWLAYFADDLWLRNAKHANAMAAKLAQGVTKAGFTLLHPVQANELFVVMTSQQAEALWAQGAQFYRWRENLYRLVTSWMTTPEEVERFVALLPNK